MIFITEAAIYQNPVVVKKTNTKAVFRMLLQDGDIPNRNHRVYPINVIAGGLAQCNNRMKRRAFLGELDHPPIKGNRVEDQIRQSTVYLNCSSHIVRDYDIKGNQIFGELETLRTVKGKELFSLVEDNIGIGISMRGMGDVKKRVDGLDEVCPPLTIISYDCVSRPSHQAALVDFNEINFMESLNIIHESTNGKTICINDQCYLAEYFDELVETKIIKIRDRWI